MSRVTTSISRRSLAERKASTSLVGYVDIRSSIVELLNAAWQTVARNVNSLMTASYSANYWEIGRRIVEAEQKGNTVPARERQLR